MLKHFFHLFILGIAPLYQIAKSICLDQEDSTQIRMISSNHVCFLNVSLMIVSLFFTNFLKKYKSEDDIILRNELDLLARNYPNKFKIWYTITRSIRAESKRSIF